MYAIIHHSGKQFKVEPNTYLYVNRVPEAVGESLSLDQVLLVDNDGSIRVGQPLVNGAQVKATVLEHLKDDKVMVFKKKRRKGYKVKKGHRQALSKLHIDSISL